MLSNVEFIDQYRLGPIPISLAMLVHQLLDDKQALLASGYREPWGLISQRVDELIAEILWKLFMLRFRFCCSNQVAYLHMSQQLSCRDMCKNCDLIWWLFFMRARCISERFGSWAHKLFSETYPCSSLTKRTQSGLLHSVVLTKMRPEQNGCHLAYNIFKTIFLNENVHILNKISLKFVPKGPIDKKPFLVQVMAWHLTCNKPLHEPMSTWPQWVKYIQVVCILWLYALIGNLNGLVTRNSILSIIYVTESICATVHNANEKSALIHRSMHECTGVLIMMLIPNLS